MNVSEILAAIDLPNRARVDQRVPKRLLLENGAPTASDKRLINDSVEGLLWVAALKPTTVGVPEFRDEMREYLEIAILHLILRRNAKRDRLVELIHRAVPYPVLLLMDQAVSPCLSAAHKRQSQGETGKTVLDGDVVTTELKADDAKFLSPFYGALALSRQPRSTLYALYQGWIDVLHALQAARLTGTFSIPVAPSFASARRDALQEYQRLDAAIERLRAIASKEKQIPRQVELNMELKRLEAKLETCRKRINWGV